ncbi:MAG: carbamoylphosphate synthase [Bacteroidetes bacterium]|jgi:carbamoyl-phosphate synthase large subunit|nr:carbamoylphosphate synthase [Bacteroidota bacterium]
MKKRILLSGLGGSLFPYLHNKLKNSYDLYYVDSDESLKDLYPDLNFFPAPLVTSKEYSAFIEDLISKHSIEIYIPLIDEEIEIAHRIKNKLPFIKLLSADLNFCTLALRKDLLMKELKAHGISEIKTWTGDNFEWSEGVFFVKPISGRGSRGIRKISSEQELKAYYLLEKYKPKDILIQECIEGQEYTVGALINPCNDLIYLSTRKILKKKGITIKAITENNSAIDDAVDRIRKSLKPKGPINVQLYITDKGEVKIFEINPRFSTTTIMSYEDGHDEIGLWLRHFDSKYEQQLIRPKTGLILHRRWENVFYERS